VEFGDVLYYHTPPAQTNSLASGQTIVFEGNYTFTDANTNGISDAWEDAHFGVVENRPPDTDTDSDGMTDLAEFIAGTDPNLIGSAFRLTGVMRVEGGGFQLTWPSRVDRGYRVYGSTNAVQWQPLSVWTQATSGIMNHPLPSPAPGAPYLFRVEVQP
jgi:hypothetical protein